MLKVVLVFLNVGDLSEEVNSTLLYLIHKVTSPEEMNQFRAISLCNVGEPYASDVCPFACLQCREIWRRKVHETTHFIILYKCICVCMSPLILVLNGNKHASLI